MLIHRTPLMAGILALAFAAPALAQTPATPGTADTPAAPPAVTMPPADTAPTGTAPAETAPTGTAPAGTAPAGTSTTATPAMDCEAEFARRDTDGSGLLSETEAPSYYARARIDGKEIAASGVSKEEFLAACDGDAFDRTEPEAGAPFEGANSFTENQARDRAIAWGVTDVAEMSKDDQGIWRSTGRLDGADVNVAVDYKGNVVATPK